MLTVSVCMMYKLLLALQWRVGLDPRLRVLSTTSHPSLAHRRVTLRAGQTHPELLPQIHETPKVEAEEISHPPLDLRSGPLCPALGSPGRAEWTHLQAGQPGEVGRGSPAQILPSGERGAVLWPLSFTLLRTGALSSLEI